MATRPISAMRLRLLSMRRARSSSNSFIVIVASVSDADECNFGGKTYNLTKGRSRRDGKSLDDAGASKGEEGANFGEPRGVGGAFGLGFPRWRRVANDAVEVRALRRRAVDARIRKASKPLAVGEGGDVGARETVGRWDGGDGTIVIERSTVGERLEEMVEEMIDHDLEEARKEAYLKRKGFKVVWPRE